MNNELLLNFAFLAIVVWISLFLSNLFVNRVKVRIKKALWQKAIVDSFKAPITFLILAHAIDIVVRNLLWTNFFASLAAEFNLNVLQHLTNYLNHIPAIINASAFAWFCFKSLNKYEQLYMKQEAGKKPRESNVEASNIALLVRSIQIILITLISFIVLDILNVDIRALLTFGGIGAFAASFAARDLLANIFGAVAIFSDKPFAVGDYVSSPDKNIQGTVEWIGWRTTRIRRDDKSLLTVPNGIFTNIIIDNASSRGTLRFLENLRIIYKDLSKIPAICQDIEKLLAKNAKVNQDEIKLAKLNKFSDYAAEIQVACFFAGTDYKQFMEFKHELLMKLDQIVEAHKAKLAFIPGELGLIANKK